MEQTVNLGGFRVHVRHGTDGLAVLRWGGIFHEEDGVLVEYETQPRDWWESHADARELPLKGCPT
jgi:hypothetical protein